MEKEQTFATGFTSPTTVKPYDTVLEKGKPGEIYNVSAGNEITNIEIVKKIIAY